MSNELITVTSDITATPNIWTGIESILAGQLAPSSIAMYQRDVKAYVTFATEHQLDTINPQTLIEWRNNLASNTKKSPNTINRMISAVKRLVKEASTNNLIPESTALKFQNVDGVKVKALKTRLKQNARTRISQTDMRNLCESPDTNTLVGIRDRALLLSLASSGIRASELATLTVNQIKPTEGGYFIEVCGKTDTEMRDAHLSKEAYTAISLWLDARQKNDLPASQYIFTSFAGKGNRPTDHCLSETAVWLVVKKYADKIGLAHIKPHDFRRFVGTQLAKKDIRKAQKALGHKSIEVTARHYVLDTLEVGETDGLF